MELFVVTNMQTALVSGEEKLILKMFQEFPKFGGTLEAYALIEGKYYEDETGYILPRIIIELTYTDAEEVLTDVIRFDYLDKKQQANLIRHKAQVNIPELKEYFKFVFLNIYRNEMDFIKYRIAKGTSTIPYRQKIV